MLKVIYKLVLSSSSSLHRHWSFFSCTAVSTTVVVTTWRFRPQHLWHAKTTTFFVVHRHTTTTAAATSSTSKSSRWNQYRSLAAVRRCAVPPCRATNSIQYTAFSNGGSGLSLNTADDFFAFSRYLLEKETKNIPISKSVNYLIFVDSTET